MSTREDKRNESKVQYIETSKDLVVHTWRYIHKLPKSCRFTVQTKINDLVLDVYDNNVKANTIFLRKDNINDKERRREYLLKSLCALNSLEGILSITQIAYKQDISDFGWSNWGKLINDERAMLVALIKSLD